MSTSFVALLVQKILLGDKERRTKKNGERKGDGNRFIGITRIRNDANIFR